MSTLQACIILVICFERAQIEAVAKGNFQVMLGKVHELQAFQNFSRPVLSIKRWSLLPKFVYQKKAILFSRYTDSNFPVLDSYSQVLFA